MTLTSILSLEGIGGREAPVRDASTLQLFNASTMR
jgi:hypothetical protein